MEIERLLREVSERKASDLHLQEGQPAKFRVSGEIEASEEGAIGRDVLQGMLSKLATPKQWQTFAERGDLDFGYQLDAELRFRVNYFKHSRGLGAVFRIIPTRIRTLDELGSPAAVKRFADLRSGMVLVTGPTGSGKSTTLAAVIDLINASHARHVVTIEEPIEFVHKNKLSLVTQREIGSEAPSFATALRAALREDADVIMLGEMRDLETISLALTAAETGALVFGTLHTNNSRQTIDRIVDVFPSAQQAQIRTMVASTLRGIVAQVLLKRADGKGLIAAYELLLANSAVASILREGKPEKLTDVITSGQAEGMQLLDISIMSLLKMNAVTIFEAYMKSQDKSRFEGMLPKDNVLNVAEGRLPLQGAGQKVKPVEQ